MPKTIFFIKYSFNKFYIYILQKILVLSISKTINSPRQGGRGAMTNLGKKISFNVPAVCDVLPARIRACVARPGLAKCAGTMAWEWSEAK
jgi:hypothetical protein